MPRELTFSCFRGYKLLDRDRARKWFVDSLQSERMKWPIDLWAWVIMPEHVHLIVAPREPTVEVGRFAGRVKESVSRKAVAWFRQNAPGWLSRITVLEGQRSRHRFWQPGGGFDRNIDQVKTLEAMIHYVHQNPVRRGLVKRAEDWEWSSARWYANIPPVHLEMDRTLPGMDQ